MSTNFNPKKNNKDRRKRPPAHRITKQISYAEVKHKSNAGVEYIHYEPIVVNI